MGGGDRLPVAAGEADRIGRVELDRAKRPMGCKETWKSNSVGQRYMYPKWNLGK